MQAAGIEQPRKAGRLASINRAMMDSTPRPSLATVWPMRSSVQGPDAVAKKNYEVAEPMQDMASLRMRDAAMHKMLGPGRGR